MSERRRLITVIALSAVAVVIAAAGAAAIGLLADRGGEVVVSQEPGSGSGDDANDSESSPGVSESPDGSTDHPDAGENDTTDGDEMNAGKFEASGRFLPRPMGGQPAIDSLGDQLERVAAQNNRTVDELRDLLLRDETVKITPSGFLLYIDTARPNIAEDSSE